MLVIIYSHIYSYLTVSYLCALLATIIFHVGKTEVVIHKDEGYMNFKRSSLKCYLIFSRIHCFFSWRKRNQNKSLLPSLLILFSTTILFSAFRNNKLVVSDDIFLEDWSSQSHRFCKHNTSLHLYSSFHLKESQKPFTNLMQWSIYSPHIEYRHLQNKVYYVTG